MLKRLVYASLAAALILPVAAQDESLGDKIRQLLQEGTELYKRGKYPEASSKFEEAFQMQPSSDQVYAFIKRAGEDMIHRMMSDDDRKIQDIARRLMELAKPGEPLREGKAVVLKYIEDLKSSDHTVWRNAFWHLKNFGPWSVRFFIGALGDEQQDQFRSRVMLLLTEMGVDASLAVVEVLDAKSEFARQNAAIVLGNVKDERAIPALKRLAESANESANVKKFADEALRKIVRGKDSASLRKATDYYYELAMKYYYSHSTVILSFQRHYLIWKWDAERDVLTERKVARMSYNEQLAEEALYDLLELDPNYTDKATGFSAWSLLACVHFAQELESRAAVESALDALRVEELDTETLVKLLRDVEGMSDASIEAIGEAIKGASDFASTEKAVMDYYDRNAKMLRAKVLGQLPGKRYLYESLARSLQDGNALVAKSAIDAIAEMGRADDLPGPASSPEGGPRPPADQTAGVGGSRGSDGTMGAPLVDALTNEDKRVRYAAARAMVALNPQRRKLGMELVVPNLVDALGEQGVRVALVICDVADDNDRNFVNGFRKLLTSMNVFPVFATTGAEGVIKAKQFPTEDVIIIQRKICSQIYFRESDTKKEIVETVFDTLRDDVRTRNIPRLVLGDSIQEVEAAQKEYQEKGTAAGVIGRDATLPDLKGIFEKLFDSEEAKKDSKHRADEIARDAAESLASIDPTNTLYPYRDAVDGLIKTVAPEPLRQDFIRIPAARALGRFGDQRAVDVLAKVVESKEADAEAAARQKGVRLASAKALSGIFRQTGVTPANEVFEVLKANLKDGDVDIEFTCAEALGNATLDNPARLDVSKVRRIVRETVTAEDP
jgi:HEAT repeat protein